MKNGQSRMTPHARRIADLYLNRWDKRVEYTEQTIRAQREAYKERHKTEDGFKPSYVFIDNRLSIASLNKFMERNHVLCMFAHRMGSKFLCFDVDAKTADGQGDLYLSGSTARSLISVLKDMGVPEEKIHTSFSGKKGYHIGIFFQDRLETYYTRRIYNEAMNRLHALCKAEGVRCCDVEFRPTTTQSIKLPLSVHKDTGKVAWFTNHDLKPIEDYNHLFSIQRLTEDETRALVELCGDAELVVEQEPTRAAGVGHSRRMKQEPSGTQRASRMLRMGLAAAYKRKDEDTIRSELRQWIIHEFGEDRLAEAKVQEDLAYIPKYAIAHVWGNDASISNRSSLASKESHISIDNRDISLIDNTYISSPIKDNIYSINNNNDIYINNNNFSSDSIDTRKVTLPEQSHQCSISKKQLWFLLNAKGRKLRLRTGCRVMLFTLFMCTQNRCTGRTVESWAKIPLSRLSKLTGMTDRDTRESIRTLCEVGLLNKCVIEIDAKTGVPYRCLDFHGNPVHLREIEMRRLNWGSGHVKPDKRWREIWEKYDTNRYLPLLPTFEDGGSVYSCDARTLCREDFFKACAHLLSPQERRKLLAKGERATVDGLPGTDEDCGAA